MKFATLALIGATAGLATLFGAGAQAASAQHNEAQANGAPAGETCFRTTHMNNHTIANDHTIYFNVFPHKTFELTTSNNCFAGAFSTDPLIMTHVPPNTDLVCRATDIDIRVAHGGVSSPCIINSIRQMSPAEVAALPPKLRP